MHDVRLRRTEKNDILRLIEGSGLNPLDFEWMDEDIEEWADTDGIRFRCSVLLHIPTGYFCKFGGIRVEFSPGPERRVEAEEHRDVWNIKQQIAHLWLEELRTEAGAPDLWAFIGQEKALSSAAFSGTIDNRPFNASERKLIAGKVDEIKGYLLEGRRFDAEQMKTIEREFAYLRIPRDVDQRSELMSITIPK